MVLSRISRIALGLIACIAVAAAQDAPKKKVAKDQAEADLINGILKDPDAGHRLTNLDKWAKDYPTSDFADVRSEAYVMTYQQLNRPKDAFSTAVAMLKADPNSELALRTIIGGVYGLNPPSPGDLDNAEKASSYLLANLDAIYAADKRPPNQTEAAWTQLKPTMKVYAQRTLGWVAMNRKDNQKAEDELTKTLQLDPTQAAASLWLAQVLFAQRTASPQKQPEYIFEMVRASTYAGPNSLPAAARQQMSASIAKTYAQYHGSNDGYDQLVALAKTNALPPADFKIEDTSQVAADKIKAEEAAIAANPELALWRTIKMGLTGDNPDAFFEMNVKGTEIPGAGAAGVTKFKGKLISQSPALRPKTLVLAVEKPDVADVTLKLDEALPGKMDPGSDLQFEGEPDSYTKDPYMLTLKVDDPKTKIVGWTGKNPPARKAAPKKAQ